MARVTAAEPISEAYQRMASDHPNFGLFSSGGPFESFPGPVLVAGPSGVVLGANAAAEWLVKLLQSGGTPELREAIEAGLDGRVAQISPLSRRDGDKQGKLGQSFDLLVLPWADAPAALLLGRDITLERSLRGALIESRQRFKDLIEASSDFAWEIDSEGRFTFVSEKGALGYAAGELIGTPAASLLGDHELAATSPFTAQLPANAIDIWMKRADGSAACVSTLALPLIGSDGAWCGNRGLCRDVTAEREREAALRQSQTREQILARIMRVAAEQADPAHVVTVIANELHSATRASGVAIYRQDAQRGLVLVANAGLTPSRPDLDALVERVVEQERDLTLESGDLRVVTKATRFGGRCNGVLCLCQGSGVGDLAEEEELLLGEIAAFLGIANDHAARKAELQRLTTTDPVTALLNRRAFLELAERRLVEARSRGRAMALFWIEGENFKQFNDVAAFDRGDELLEALSRELRRQVRESDVVGRVGDAAFAVLIDGLPPKLVNGKAEELLAATGTVAALTKEGEPRVGFTVGVAELAQDRKEDLRSMISRAAAAHRTARDEG